MWGRGFQQRMVEELVELESRGRPGRRPPSRGYAGLGALTLAAAIVLLVLFYGAAGDGPPADASPAPSESASPTTVVGTARAPHLRP